MTALAVFAQPRRGVIHVATDAAHYLNGQIVSFGPKVVTVPHWPGVVTGVGNGALQSLAAWELAQAFATFDDAISGVSSVMPRVVQTFEGLTGANVVFAGISASRGPESYSVRTDDRLPPGVTRAQAEASPYWGRVFEPVRMPAAFEHPVPNDHAIDADWEHHDPDADPAMVAWSMRKMLTMQRHTALPANVGGIGGWGELTTISRDGVSQRVIVRWPEDRIGERLRPAPIDWRAWHAVNPKPQTEARTLRVVH